MSRGTATFIIPLCYALAIGAAATAIAIASYAPWPDEMWGYTQGVALYRGETPHAITTFRLFGYAFPLLTGEYQGAFKSYLHAIFLLVTGGAAPLQRWLNFALFAAVALAMAWAIRPVARGWLAAVPALAAVCDPNYVAFVPSDMGPFLLQNLFTALAAGFMLRAALGGEARHLIAAILFCGAIAGEKLTGIPVAVGIGAVCLVITLRDRATFLTWRTVILSGILAAIPVLPFLVFFVRGGFGATVGMIGTDTLGVRVVRAIVEIGYVFTGDHAYLLDAIYRAAPFIGVRHFSFAIAALALIMLAVCSRNPRLRRTDASYAAALIALAIAVTAAAFVLVPGLGRPWNFLIFHPVIYLGVGALVAWAVDDARTLGSDALRHVTTVALVALALNFVIAQANVVGMLAYQSTNRGKELASLAIYPLIETLKQRGVRTVVCMDYGPCQSIYILTAGAIEMDGREFSRDFDAEPFAKLLDRPGAVMLLRRMFDVKDQNWQKRITPGTRWFEERGRDRLPPLDIVVLPRFDDTQYALATLKR